MIHIHFLSLHFSKYRDVNLFNILFSREVMCILIKRDALFLFHITSFCSNRLIFNAGCESRYDEVIAAAFTRVSIVGNFIGLLSPDWRNDKMFIVRNSRRIIAPSVEIVMIRKRNEKWYNTCTLKMLRDKEPHIIVFKWLKFIFVSIYVILFINYNKKIIVYIIRKSTISIIHNSACLAWRWSVIGKNKSINIKNTINFFHV